MPARRDAAASACGPRPKNRASSAVASAWQAMATPKASPKPPRACKTPLSQGPRLNPTFHVIWYRLPSRARCAPGARAMANDAYNGSVMVRALPCA